MIRNQESHAFTAPIRTVIFGSGQIGQMTARLLGTNFCLICFADNNEAKWGHSIGGVPISPLAECLQQAPELIILGVLDDQRQTAMRRQLQALGYHGTIRTPSDLTIFDARIAVMRLLAEQIAQYHIPGDVAELGVFQGAFSTLINAAFPTRTLHLFDTFEGFSEKDVTIEQTEKYSGAQIGDFHSTSVESVLKRLPYPEKAVIHKGWFPDTFDQLACIPHFCFVSLDADLYAPTAAGLPRFYEYLSPGGVLLIHDVYSTQFSGCRRAVEEFCARQKLLPDPVCDLHGSAIIRKPYL